MVGLYLDGVNDLTHLAAEYHAEVSTECFDFKRDIWLRITILAHLALTLLRTCVAQFLRGTGNLIAGIVHLDSERILMGLNDYLSLLIQAVVLPIFGIAILFLPKTGFKMLIHLRDCLDAERQTSDIVYVHEPDKKEALHTLRQGCADVIMGIFGGISALFQMLTLALEQLLSLNPCNALETLRTTGSLVFLAPKEGVVNCCKVGHAKEIYSAHRVALESYKP